jgi:SPP1 family predicted phage head-tail adaptor
MRAGSLNCRVAIEHQTLAPNSIGEDEITWTTFATVWAAIEPATGNTYYAAKQLESKTDGRIRIRYIEGLKSTMRIKYNDRIFNILSIIHPKEDRREIQIIYSEALD